MDFDLRKSVLDRRGSAPASDMRRPGIPVEASACVVDSSQVGTVTGTVDPTLIAQVCPAGELGNVYLFGPSTDTD